MVPGGAALPVDDRELAPADGGIVRGEGRDHLAGRRARLEEIEPAGPEARVRAVLGEDRADARPSHTGSGRRR